MIILRNIVLSSFKRFRPQVLNRFQNRIVPMIKEQPTQEETHPRGEAG
jgi:hypothetical protein